MQMEEYFQGFWQCERVQCASKYDGDVGIFNLSSIIQRTQLDHKKLQEERRYISKAANMLRQFHRDLILS